MSTGAFNDGNSNRFQPNLLQRFAVRLLATSSLPKHVVFIVDFSKQCETSEEINDIFKKVVDNCVEIVSWLDYVDIPEISLYICEPKQNKDTKGQMKTVMQAVKKMNEHLPKLIDQLKQNETRFTFFGDLDLLPKNLRTIFAKAMLETNQFKKNRFNLGFVYTTSDEMDLVVETLQNGIKHNELLLNDIDETLINRCLYTGESNAPEMIVRLNTGERFNDTFQWQQSHSMFTFFEVDTINITFTQFLTVLFVAQYFTEKYRNVAPERIETIDLGNNENESFEKLNRIKNYFGKRSAQFLDSLKKLSM